MNSIIIMRYLNFFVIVTEVHFNCVDTIRKKSNTCRFMQIVFYNRFSLTLEGLTISASPSFLSFKTATYAMLFLTLHLIVVSLWDLKYDMDFWLSVCNESFYSCLVGYQDLCGLAEAMVWMYLIRFNQSDSFC